MRTAASRWSHNTNGPLSTLLGIRPGDPRNGGVRRVNPQLAKAVVEMIGCSAEVEKLAMQTTKQSVG
jgi:hypothetical protein